MSLKQPLTPADLEFRSNIDGDLHLVLPAGERHDGWEVTVVTANGDREAVAPETTGAFSYYYDAACWWFIDLRDAAHVEVVAPDGATTIRHHDRFEGFPDSCPACSGQRAG